MTRAAKSYCCYLCSRGTSFSESFHRYKEGEIPTTKGRYPVIRTNMKPQQLIKHTKISYSIASLVFYKFSCVTYRHGLNRGTSKQRHSKYLKKYDRVSLILFVGNLHFSIPMHRVWYLRNLFVSRNYVIIFPG